MKGDKNKMARNVNTTLVPKVTLHVLTHKTDGSILEKLFHVDDMVENLRYADNGKIHKVSGRISDVKFNVAKTKRLYTSVSKAKSWFRYDVIPTDLCVDASTEYHADVRNIPVRELLEDEDILNVKMINSYLSYGFHAEILRSDDTTNIFDVTEGDILTGIRYLFRGDETVIPSARLIAIKRDGTSMKPVTLVLNLDNKIRQIQVMQLVDILGSIKPIEDTDTITDNIDPNNAEKQILYLGTGVFYEKLSIANNVAIKGNKAGVWGTSKNRDKNSYENETVIAGHIDVKQGAHLTIDGCVLTKDALISIESGCDAVEIKNCVIKDLVGTTTRSAFIFGYSTEETKLNVDNCYFGSSQNMPSAKIYNLFELEFPLRNNSSISGNYFEKDACAHNFINLYDAADDATIMVEDNTFEYSGTAVRIGFKGDAHCTVNINDLAYFATDESDGGKWAGMMMIQPYRDETITMENVRININNVKRKTPSQLYFMYSVANEGYTILTEENAPVVVVNGKEYPRLFNHIQGSYIPTLVDKSKLIELKASADALIKSEDIIKYTTESVSVLFDALKNATMILNNQEATQVEVDAQVNVLQSAIDGLKETDPTTPTLVNKEALLSLISSATGKLNQTDITYTEDSKDRLQTAISHAQAVVDNNESTQEIVDAEIEALQFAVDGLVEKEKDPEPENPTPTLVNKETLIALITTANTKLAQTNVTYTDESKDKVQVEITNAQAIVNDAEATQAEVDIQVNVLQSAIDQLEEVPVVIPVSKDRLINLIASANMKLAQTDITYTEDSKTALQYAISHAQAVVNNEEASQSDVNAEVSTLQTAIDALVEEQPEPVIVNKDSLVALIATANNKLNQSEVEYTGVTKDELRAAITSAQSVVDDTNATQNDVDTQVSALQNAINNLEEVVVTPTVSKDALVALIALANEKLTQTEINYTEESKAVLQEAIIHAQSIVDNANVTQTEVDSEVIALQNAMDSLEEVVIPPVNKEALITIIASANEKLTQTEIEYTEDSKGLLQTAVTTAQAVVDNAEATQDEVDDQVTLIQGAIEALEIKEPEPEPEPVVVNKDELITLIDTANAKLSQTEITYTDETKEALQNAVTSAQSVVDKEDATQDEVNTELSVLQVAIENLEEVDPIIASKEVLSAFLASANAKLTQTEITYTEETLNVLQAAITSAQSVVDNTEATLDDVNAEVFALQNAINGLVEKQVEPTPDPVNVNKDSLVALIASANEKLSQTEVEYTEDSKDKLQIAITNAQSVIDKEDATQDEVNDQETALQLAVDNLVEKEKDLELEEPTPKVTDPTTDPEVTEE